MYIQKALESIGKELCATGDIASCIEQVHKKYTKLTTRRTAFQKLRNWIILQDIRHEKYAPEMESYRQEIFSAQSVDANRIETFETFASIPLERQIKIQKKLQSGDHSFCPPEDVAFYSSISLSPAYFDQLKLCQQDAQELMIQQHKTLLELSSQVLRIEKADDIILQARATLRKQDATPEDIAVAIAITTGRRMVEIFLTGELSADTAHGRYSAYFSGQAKSGLRKITGMAVDTITSYRIPLLATTTSVIRGIETLRKMSTSTTPHDVNQQWCKKLNQYVRETIHPEITFHDLRTLYAMISFEAFKPHRYGMNGWVAKVLGHAGVTMSVHYTRMQVSGIHRIARHVNEAAEDCALSNASAAPAF